MIISKSSSLKIVWFEIFHVSSLVEIGNKRLHCFLLWIFIFIVSRICLKKPFIVLRFLTDSVLSGRYNSTDQYKNQSYCWKFRDLAIFHWSYLINKCYKAREYRDFIWIISLNSLFHFGSSIYCKLNRCIAVVLCIFLNSILFLRFKVWQFSVSYNI